MNTHPEGDPLGHVASMLLHHEKADDILIICMNKQGRLDLSNATTDLSNVDIKTQKEHVLKLLKSVINHMETQNSKAIEGSYLVNDEHNPQEDQESDSDSFSG